MKLPIGEKVKLKNMIQRDFNRFKFHNQDFYLFLKEEEIFSYKKTNFQMPPETRSEERRGG